jgi:hypothetical protein
MKERPVLQRILIWIFAIAITLAASIYQNLTGPANPLRTTLWLNNDQVYSLKLPRSHAGKSNCMIELNVPDTTVAGDICYRRYPTAEGWQKTGMVRSKSILIASLPNQPPAGKLEYYFMFRQAGKVIELPVDEPVIIRFRGDVPAGVILPHILLMFIAMLLSNVALLFAIFNLKQYRVYAILTAVTLLIGGFVFGPLVQKYAFGQYWTGFPFGYDLTDNKTLIALVFWTLAVLANLRKNRRFWVILASLVMLVVFLIPHSARGSELDPVNGKVKTGMVPFMADYPQNLA